MVRRVIGVVLVATARDPGLQRHRRPPAGTFPATPRSLQNQIEGNDFGQGGHRLGDRRADRRRPSPPACRPIPTLQECGPAPADPGHHRLAQHARGHAAVAARAAGQGRPGRLLDLLVHQLPADAAHVEAWYKQYANDGLVVVGVHTPEFAFEHVVSNVGQAAGLGVHYPVAIDNNYDTWNAYEQRVLAGRLPDRRHRRRPPRPLRRGRLLGHRELIRQLLTDAHPTASLPGAGRRARQDPHRAR